MRKRRSRVYSARLADQRVRELQALIHRLQFSGRRPPPTLATFAAEHLIAMKRAGKVTDAWIAATEGYLRAPSSHFGDGRPLDSISPSDVRAFAEWLGRQSARKPRPAGKPGQPKRA